VGALVMSKNEWLFTVATMLWLLLCILYAVGDRLLSLWMQLWCHHVYRVTFDGAGNFLHLQCSACGKRSR
jgi:hypothetical protein